jgi:hypothetical protein
MSETLSDMTADLAVEFAPSLEDFAEESGGAWPAGWYPGEIIEGYSTPKGKQFLTDDFVSGKGDSRNLRLCFRVQGALGDRTIQEVFNYRPSDFTAERMAYVTQARLDHKGVQGKWNDDPDGQRSSLAVAKIGAIEKALGFSIHTVDGRVVPGRAVGQKVDVRLNINAEGFNDITKFDKAGAKTGRKS